MKLPLRHGGAEPSGAEGAARQLLPQTADSVSNVSQLPRNLTGAQLIKALERLGYQSTRQAGSHVRLSCTLPKEHHLTVPLHDPLRIGTLASILADVATHHSTTRDELIRKLFGK